MIFERIKKEIKKDDIIPQPREKGYKVKGFGKSRRNETKGEETLVYFIPNHNNPSYPNEKRISVVGLGESFYLFI